MKAIILIYLAFAFSIHSFSQWVPLQSGTSQALYDICFINEYTGIAAGSGGLILRTTNSGQNWSVISGPVSYNIFSLCFNAAPTGYGSGQTGFVIKTTNNGSLWFNAASCGIEVRSISFINSLTGITGGGGTLMCHTTDGAYSWNPRFTPTSHAVTGLHYYSADLLVVCATDMPGAVLHKSTSGGTSWSTVLMLNNSGIDIFYSLVSVYMKDSYTGFASGSYQYYSQNWGQIYRTTNSGNNWVLTGSIGPATGNVINNIHFGDSQTGFAAGSNGIIMKTTNSGTNWIVQTSGSTLTLNAVFMVNSMTGYICGNNGLILKTTNGGVTGLKPVTKSIPKEFKLYQNYPNPFNPVTKIRFAVPSNVKPKGRREMSNVKILLYDVLGRGIASLINEHVTPGIYEVEFDGSNLVSGVYYYTLSLFDPSKGSGQFYFKTKKMVLLK